MANEDYNYDDIERRLQEEARQRGVSYDPSDLDGVKRNSQYDSGGISPDEALSRQLAIYDQRATNTPSGGGGGGSNNITQAWSGGGGTSQPSWYDSYMKEMIDRNRAADTERKQRADGLFSTLQQRSQQGLAVDRNDPVIRAQADAFSANQQRQGREHLADLAERAGPTANLLGEQRLMAERVGQATGGFEAELMGRELQTRRAEIADALQQMGDLLSADQAAALQRELSALDQAIREQQIALGNRGLDIEWQRALMQNDQFSRSLGLSAWDRENYWDAARRGIL